MQSTRFNVILLLTWVLTCSGLLAITAPFSLGQITAEPNSTGNKSTKNSGDKSPTADLTVNPMTTPAVPATNSEREAFVWGFVMQHHPELGEVLSRLKTMHPIQFEKAINQVQLAAERINRLTKNDKKRGEYELQDWKYESQIKLLAAKLSLMGQDQALVQEQLTKIVQQQMELRIAISEYDRDKALLRAKTLEEQSQRLRKSMADDTAKRVKALRDEINRTRSNLKNDASKKPNAKTKAAAE